MNKILYITYCCKNKAELAENIEVYPEDLYLSSRIHSFIDMCEKHNYNWAIFSDKYGLVYKNEKIKWYDKSPATVTPAEYYCLLNMTITRLAEFECVYFFYQDHSFHPLYKQLVNDIKKYKRIKTFNILE